MHGILLQKWLPEDKVFSPIFPAVMADPKVQGKTERIEEILQRTSKSQNLPRKFLLEQRRDGCFRCFHELSDGLAPVFANEQNDPREPAENVRGFFCDFRRGQARLGIHEYGLWRRPTIILMLGRSFLDPYLTSPPFQWRHSGMPLLMALGDIFFFSAKNSCR